jgi:AraC-like DNA-binding protein
MATLLTILSTFVVGQLLLLSLFLITSRKGKRISNVLLALFFFLLLINLADGIISYFGFYTRFPQLAHIEDGFVFLFGPVLYFYTLSFVYRDFAFRARDILHTLPFAVLTIAYQLYYHLQPEEYQTKIQEAIVNRSLPAGFYVFAFLIYAHVCVYIYFAYRHIKLYRIEIRQSFSSVDKLNLEWLSFMLTAFAILLFLSFVYTFIPPLGLRNLFDPLFILSLLFIFFFASAIVWKGLRQPEIFAGINHPVIVEPKYSGTIGTDEKDSAIQLISTLMVRDKIFLDPELTLEKMAERTPYSAKRLSQLINSTYNQNFFDFINSYRIKEAEIILKEPQRPKPTILEVMYACGFSSKSSFNTIFKQKTGMTPSDYRKSV